MTVQESAPERYTPAEAAKYLGVHDRTIRRHIREGRLPAQRVGDRLLKIKRDDLDALLKEVTPTPPADPIREAALRVVSEAPKLTAEQLDKICNLLRGVA